MKDKDLEKVLRIVYVLMNSLHEGINMISIEMIRKIIKRKTGIILSDVIDYYLKIAINQIELQANKRNIEIYFPNNIYFDGVRNKHVPLDTIILIVRKA